MASVQDIKRRVRSVQNTRKITRAMELVAAAKLRRAQTRIEAMRPYAERMQELTVGVARASTSLRGLPLLQRREVRKAAILPLTGDRGLAGAFNAQILREAFAQERRFRGDGIEPYWLVAGKKGASTLRFRRYGSARHGRASRRAARGTQTLRIAHRISELYSEQEVDQVVVIYNHFESALARRVWLRRSCHVRSHSSRAEDDHCRRCRGLHLRAEPEQILEGCSPSRRTSSTARCSSPPPRSKRRTDDGDAQRDQERRRADRLAHAVDEPGPSGGVNRSPGSGGRRRSAHDLTSWAAARPAPKRSPSNFRLVPDVELFWTLGMLQPPT